MSQLNTSQSNISNLPQLVDALLTLENRVATLTLNRHDLDRKSVV